jgi:putative ATPase
MAECCNCRAGRPPQGDAASPDIQKQACGPCCFHEIHRFNKLQQDALLPDVEEGNLILIAATVENPFFYVNFGALSRVRCLS